MSELIQWFETVPTTSERRRLIWKILALEFAITAAYLTYVIVGGDINTIIREINEGLREMAKNPPPAENWEWPDLREVHAIIASALIGMFGVGVVAPILQEFVFRLFPLGIAILAFRWISWTKPLILVIAVAAGILFGLAHIYNENATLASVLLLQGIGGIFYGFLFAKVSGLKMKGLWRAYKTTVFLHGFWNLVAVPIIAIAVFLVFGSYIMAHIEIPPELLK